MPDKALAAEWESAQAGVTRTERELDEVQATRPGDAEALFQAAAEHTTALLKLALLPP